MLLSQIARRPIAAALLALSGLPSPPPATAEDAAAISTAASVDPATAVVTNRCFLDVSVGGSPAGRLVIDLFGQLTPRTAENFRALCTGEKGFGYAGSSIYRIISGQTLQGGDVGRSIYGDKFPHENYELSHISQRGVISMVNSGVGGGSKESDSRFLIQLVDDAGYLDGRYVGFGRVVEGLEVLTKLENLPVKGSKNRPVESVVIEKAGELPLAAGAGP